VRKGPRHVAQRGHLQTPFVFHPAGREITAQQEDQAAIPVCVGVSRLQREGAINTLQCFFKPVEIAQRYAAIIPGHGEVRPQLQGAINTRHCLQRPIQRIKRVTTIIQGISIVWPERNCPVKARQRL
jgi:hypothetical protein